MKVEKPPRNRGGGSGLILPVCRVGLGVVHLHLGAGGPGDDGAGLLLGAPLPWSSGTGGASLRGWVCVQSGRAMPCFAIKITSGDPRLPESDAAMVQDQVQK